MNLHVTCDRYGLFPLVIAKRIKESDNRDKNFMVNLSLESTLRDDIITYIPFSKSSLKNYLEKINCLEKIIFHCYKYESSQFLKIAKKKFPKVKAYWVVWSAELYTVPPLPANHYGPFSRRYLKANMRFPERLKKLKIIGKLILGFSYLAGFKRNYIKELKRSYKEIDFFCAFIPSDFLNFRKISLNEITKYLPFAYLSLEEIMPELMNFSSTGDKVMVGHSSSPDGNHFEILIQLYEIDPKFSIFLPLAYGDEKYGDLIEAETKRRFENVDCQRTKLEKVSYYKKLTEIGWAIINVKVQSGLGNIIALIWMGVKVFLDEESSTFKDFINWGLIIFSVQRDLNTAELHTKLTGDQIAHNRKIIFDKCNEQKVKKYWNNILS